MILLVTNVPLRMAQRSSSHHRVAFEAVLRLHRLHMEMCLVPQVIYEFWVVATRPVEVNGLGMSVNQVRHSLDQLVTDFRLFRDERGIFDTWQELVVDRQVLGKGAHDARLVAAMNRHGLSKLLTFNPSDFQRYQSITVITPDEVVRADFAIDSEH